MISTSVTNNISTVTSNYVTTTEFAAPTLRARTVVISAKKLKPSTTMNLFISGIEANMYYAPCVMIEISMVGTNQFLDASTSGNVIDNLPMRTTTVNSYDTINVGEIVASGNIVYGPQSWFPTTGLFGGGWLNMGNFRGNTSGWLGGNATLVSGGY